jgi:hypothetical protein
VIALEPPVEHPSNPSLSGGIELTQDGTMAIMQLRRITAQSREKDSNIDSRLICAKANSGT